MCLDAPEDADESSAAATAAPVSGAGAARAPKAINKFTVYISRRASASECAGRRRASRQAENTATPSPPSPSVARNKWRTYFARAFAKGVPNEPRQLLPSPSPPPTAVIALDAMVMKWQLDARLVCARFARPALRSARVDSTATFGRARASNCCRVSPPLHRCVGRSYAQASVAGARRCRPLAARRAPLADANANAANDNAKSQARRASGGARLAQERARRPTMGPSSSHLRFQFGFHSSFSSSSPSSSSSTTTTTTMELRARDSCAARLGAIGPLWCAPRAGDDRCGGGGDNNNANSARAAAGADRTEWIRTDRFAQMPPAARLPGARY